MIIYTDLHNRTKNYTLPEDRKQEINKKFNVQIVTTINSKAEVYWGDKLTNEHLTKMPNLKWIHLSKTGWHGKFNFPDGVIVTYSPKSSDGVAEYALTGILYLLRGIDRMVLNRKSFDSNMEYILPFNEVKCLIVGYGNIGKKLAGLLKSIEIKVDIIDKNNFQNLDWKVRYYNFVINCLPLNNSTKECFKLSTFTSMSSYSYFINVGRGETVNEKDLFYVLDNNFIRGAFLDVVQNEPIKKDNQLLYLDNIFISPHIANFSNKSQDIQIKDFIVNLSRYNQNKPLLNVVYNSIGEKI